MKLMHKLILAFAAVSLFSGLIGLIGLYADRQVMRSFESGEKQFGAIIEASNEVSSYANRAEGHLMMYLALHNESDREKFFSRLEGLRSQAEIIDAIAKNPDARAVLGNITSKTGELQSAGESLLSAYDADMRATGTFDQKKYGKQIRNLDDIAAGIRNDGLTLAKVELDLRTNQEESAKKDAGFMYDMMVAASAIAVLGALAFGYFMSRGISGPIAKLKNAADNIGSGRFDASVDIRPGDELGDLAGAFNKMAGELQKSSSEISKTESALRESKRELEQKVADMAEAKTAILNMMEDTEELNREIVAAHKRMEENFTELKEADIKKNEFMSIAAHELKTPMTSIHGFSQLLQNPAIAGDREKRNKYLAIMDKETTRLAKLVNDILDLSRVDLGAVTFDISEVDVSHVIDSVKTEMGVQTKAKGIESEYIVDKNLPKINTDRERLTQVLMNLINNAVKYTPKGKITVKVFGEDKGVHFVVKDTGIGIAKKNQPKIFSRFYQVDSSYTRSAGGVGLGLSLCREFIELLGGKIWFESELGRGSEFHFTLPVRAPAAAQKRKIRYI